MERVAARLKILGYKFSQACRRIPRLYRASLRARIFFLIFFALIPSFVLLSHNAYQEVQTARTEAQQTALRLVRLTAQSQEQVISHAHELLAVLSRLPHTLLTSPDCDAMFADFPRRFPNFANVAVFTPAGEVVCSFLPGTKEIGFAERPWLQETLKSGKFTTSGYLIGKTTRLPSIIFTHPVLDGGAKVTAVIGLSMRLNRTSHLGEEAQLPAGSTVTVFDSNGIILGRHPDPGKWTGHSYPGASLIKKILEKQQGEGTAETAGLDGIKRLYAYKRLGDSHGVDKWYLAVGIPKAVVYGPGRAHFMQNLAWMGVVAILVLLTGWIGGNKLILDRLWALSAASQKIADGDLNARTGMDREPDEIGRLAATFDQMAESLQARAADKQRAEQSRALLAAIVESSNDAIIGRTTDGTITSWNKGAETIYGYSAEEMIGRSVAVLIPDEDVEAVQRNFQRLQQGERIECYETVRVRKNRERIAVSVTVSPVKDANGKMIGVSSITRDITERKRSEMKFRALLEAAPDAMVIVDKQGKIVLVNAQTEKVFGYRREELLGQTVEILMPEQFRNSHRQHRDRYHGEAKPRAMGSGLDLFGRRKDGSEFPVEISLGPLETEEGVLVSSAIRDISARKRAEEEIQAFQAELLRFNRLAVGRELRMVELKQQVNDLAQRLGEEPPHLLSFLEPESKITGSRDVHDSTKSLPDCGAAGEMTLL